MKLRRIRHASLAVVAVAALALTAGITSSASAVAPAWYKDSSAGIILTWGLNTGALPFTACDGNPATVPVENVGAWETQVSNLGWDPQTWVDAVQKLHGEYIVFSAFHSLQGYLRAWPSSVPGSPTTSRDYLQELIDVATPAGIKVVVYITSDPTWADTNGCDWLNSAAYNAYKGGTSYDLDNPADSGFSRFSYDVVDELMDNYPDIAGFWFDGWAGSWTSLGMVSNIKTTMPGSVIIANDFSSFAQFGEDVIAAENISKTESPAFDFPSSTWNRQNDAEGVYAPAGWDYFSTNTVPMRNMPQFEVKWLASIAGSGWPALVGLPTKLDGTFPADVNAQLAVVDDFKDWANGAFSSTVAGGYDFGIQPGLWSNGAYGTVTTNNAKTIQYLHLLQPPVGAVTRSSSGSWVSPTELNGLEIGARTISGDTAGNLWVVNTLGHIWRKSGGTWSRMPGLAQDLATGSDGSVWMAESSEQANGQVYKWNGSSWVAQSGGAVKLAIDGSGHQWIVQADGNMYRWDGSAYHSAGTGQDIANGPSGQIWKIGPPSGSANGVIYEWNTSTLSWTLRNGGGIQITVDSTGAPWLTNSFGDVHKWNGSTWVGQNLAASGMSTTLGGAVYKHAPAPLTISMPDSGYTVSDADDLRSGSNLTYSQSGGVLNVTVADWSTNTEFGDQIIELTASASSRLYPRASTTATATASAGGPASNAVDAVDTSAWNTTSVAFPVSISVQTASTQTLTGLRIAQQEFAPIISDPIGGEPWRIRSATIATSLNGVTWTNVWSGELLNQRGAQTINFAPTSGDFVRLTINSNWAGNNWAAIQALDVLKQ